MEQTPTSTRLTILPEKKFHLIKSSIDFLILLALLNKPVSAKKTVGRLINSRGVSQKYILDLVGRYDRERIEKYINALADRAGQSYDEVVEQKPGT